MTKLIEIITGAAALTLLVSFAAFAVFHTVLDFNVLPLAAVAVVVSCVLIERVIEFLASVLST